MNYKLLKILECPFCPGAQFLLFPLELGPEKYEKISSDEMEDFFGKFCESNLHMDNNVETRWKDLCYGSVGADIVTGIIYCSRCSRWYPIREGIPSIMPDTLRDVNEILILEKFQDMLPEEVVSSSKPFSLSETSNIPVKTDVSSKVELDKKQEIELRDKESKLYEILFPDEKLRAELDIYDTLCDFEPDDHVLDLGCGTGRVTKEFIDRCQQIIAVDFSFESLRYFRNRFQEEQLRKIHLMQVDVCYLPFSKEVFDNVISTGVFCCIPSQETRDMALKNVVNVLKPGGTFLISVYNHSLLKRIRAFMGFSKSGLKEGYQEGHVHYYNHTPKELVQWLSPHFQVVSLVGTDNRIPVVQNISNKLNAKLDYVISRTPFSLPIFAREMVAKTMKK